MTDHPKSLLSRAHTLKPVVLIGQNGLTAAVMHEIDQALTAHELIKIKCRQSNAQDRKIWQQDIASTQNATLIQAVGGTLVFFRKKNS